MHEPENDDKDKKADKDAFGFHIQNTAVKVTALKVIASK